MRIDERAGDLGVALHAYDVAAGTAVQHSGWMLQGPLERAVRIVTIAAVHQAFIHFVMKGLSERRFGVRVAGVAELRLRYLEQVVFALRLMYAVAAQAVDSRLAVRGVLEIGVRADVAGQAFLVYLLSAAVAELEDLCHIAPGIDVRLARSVAVFAGHALAVMHQGHLGMRIGGELIDLFLVAGCAGL